MAAIPMVGVVEMLLIAIFSSGVGVPLGIPPGEPDPMMVRIAPEKCLYYTTWVGRAQPDPDSQNQTEQLLAEEEVQQFVEGIESAARAAVLKMAARANEPLAVDLAQHLPSFVKAVITHPATVIVESVEVKRGGFDARGAVVINLADEADATRDAINRLVDKIPRDVSERVEIGGVRCLRIALDPDVPSVTWGFQDSYLIIGVGDGSVEGVLQRGQTPPPTWLTDAQAGFNVPRPSTFTYVNIERIAKIVSAAAGPTVEQMLEPLGLSSLTTAHSMSGLDESGFVSHTRFNATGPSKGLLSLCTGKPLESKDLANVPRDASIAMAVRLDVARVLDETLKIMRKIEPRAADELEQMIQNQPLPIQLKEDLLQALGDVWTVHAAPSGGGLLAGWTVAVQLRDARKLENTHKRLMQFAEGVFEQDPRAPRIRTSSFEGKTIYSLYVPEPEFFVVPSWCITQTHLVVTLLPQTLKSYLSRSDADGSLADQVAVTRLLSADPAPFAISYQDTRKQFVTFYPWLLFGAHAVGKQINNEGFAWDAGTLPSIGAVAPHLQPTVAAIRKVDSGFESVTFTTLPGASVSASAPVLVAALLPAIQAAREAARRAQSSNNLKQIALAMHNYHDTFKAFPAAYSVDEDGKPLLSWRVHILPFIEENGLYEQFHFDEPWNSPHNRDLIAKMPALYRSPNSAADPGKTVYLGNGAKDGIFVAPIGEPKGPKFPRGIGMRDIRDGTSNTLAVVEASDPVAVIWTKPGDFVPDQDDPLQGLMGIRPQGFIAAFCDGAVRFLSSSIRQETLQGLFTRNGAEILEEF